MRVETVNLAANGQLPADSYSVALKAAEDADLVVVQLTYHAFNPAWRDGVTVRYPELPRMLGVAFDERDARVLQLEATPHPDITGSADRALRARWALYRSRDRIAAQAFGGPPDERVFAAWERLVDSALTGEDEQVPSGLPFDELEPEEQMFVLDEFSGASDYRFDANDVEAVALGRLAERVAASRRRVAFYVSPLNIAALKDADLYDAEQVDANVAGMREIVERHELRFIDLSREPLDADAFADINHGTATGNDAVARILWRELGGEVGAP